MTLFEKRVLCQRSALAVTMLTMFGMPLSAAAQTVDMPTPPAQSIDVPTPPAMSVDVPAPAAPVAAADVEPLPCVDGSAYMDMALDFERDPQNYLNGLSTRGTSLAIPTRNIVASRPDLLDPVIEQLLGFGTDSNEARQIALGLGQAALLCSRVSAVQALAIQEAIAGLEDETIETAFLSVTGGIETASLGNSAGNASNGSVVGAASLSDNGQVGTFGPFGDDDLTPQYSQIYTFARSGVAGSFSSNAVEVVSPTAP